MSERVLNRYDVPPFSGKKHHKNSSACPGGTSSCAICGKPVVTEGHAHWAWVTEGGAQWGRRGDAEGGPGDMGLWPVGNDCHRKHVVRADADAECTGCGKMYVSGTGHPNLPLCRKCQKGEKRNQQHERGDAARKRG